jgi:hypothetical protein
VKDEGPLGCKLLLSGKKCIFFKVFDGTRGISTG